jgi:hypothetical protein
MASSCIQAEAKSAETTQAPKEVEPITEDPEAEAEAEATASGAVAEAAPAAVPTS